MKKETRDPVNYFDSKLINTRCNHLEELIKTINSLREEGNEQLDKIYKNTEDFEREIMFYRQKMLSGKYKVHHKLHEMSHGTKECLVETLLSILSVVEEEQSHFVKMQR
jgi:hypothetical protein